jgi:hypothetical protein
MLLYILSYGTTFIFYLFKNHVYLHCNTQANVNQDGYLYGITVSCGCAETYFRYAAHTLFNREIAGSLYSKILWNSDFPEVTPHVIHSPYHLRLEGGEHSRFVVYHLLEIQKPTGTLLAKSIWECKYHFRHLIVFHCIIGGYGLPFWYFIHEILRKVAFNNISWLDDLDILYYTLIIACSLFEWGRLNNTC